jgi:hypothetical protein
VESLVPGRDSGSSASSEAREAQRPFPREREHESSNGQAADSGVARDPRAEFELGDPRVPSREAPPEPEVREPVDEPAGATAAGAQAPEAAGEADHIDTDATLVESFAEPGAEDGAGAQIRIEEPWEGYGDLNAADVIGRLEQASPAELAAVELFEAATKQRTTVLSAAERQLKARTADAQQSSGSPG